MRIEQLTFTRFIAAIAIVIFHYGQKSFLFDNQYVSFIFKQANVGVSYFFMLSGFVMIIAYGNLETINYFQYLKNRLARIYPLYVLAAFLILAVLLFKTFNLPDTLLYLSMMQTWISKKAFLITAPSWSLSVEFFFYLTFPLLSNKLYSKFSLKTNTIWIVSFWVISQIIFHLLLSKIIEIPTFTSKVFNYYPLLHINAFLAGNLAGLFYIKKLHNKQGNFLIPIFICLLLVILALKYSLGLNFHNGLLALIFIPLILFISLSNDRLTTFFKRKEFVFLGEISFAIYLLQFPVWMIFSDFRIQKYLGLEKDADYTLSFFIRLLILIVLSILSYFFFEKPLRNLIKKI